MSAVAMNMQLNSVETTMHQNSLHAFCIIDCVHQLPPTLCVCHWALLGSLTMPYKVNVSQARNYHKLQINSIFSTWRNKDVGNWMDSGLLFVL